MARKHWKMALFWVLGAVCLTFGSMIAGRLERTVGVSDSGYLLALAISLVLMLLGGLLWISVAAAVKEIP
jgi:hypothetical protein